MLEITEQEVKESMKNTGRHVSMDAPLTTGDDNAGSMYDVMQADDSPSPENGLLNESLRREIERALHTLTSREADVVRLYFGLSGEHAMTLEEIGKQFCVTRERIRQIEARALSKMRSPVKAEEIKEIFQDHSQIVRAHV